MSKKLKQSIRVAYADNTDILFFITNSVCLYNSALNWTMIVTLILVFVLSQPQMIVDGAHRPRSSGSNIVDPSSTPLLESTPLKSTSNHNGSQTAVDVSFERQASMHSSCSESCSPVRMRRNQGSDQP